MTESRSRQHFASLVSRPDAAVDLALGALLIACEEYPVLEVGRYLERLDTMAAEVRARAAGPDPESRLEALDRVLFADEGFRGNVTDYYDPRNSFLNDVLDRRTGIPITLSLVYLEVGRRAGLVLEGVGLPGHFIVRVCLPGRDRLLDPFHGGVTLTPPDCQERLDRVYGGRVRLEPSMLAPSARKAILARVLRNLKAIYSKYADALRAVAILELLVRLEPDNLPDLRERGLAYASLGSYSLAARDLEAYLAAATAAPDASGVSALVADLRERAARVN